MLLAHSHKYKFSIYIIDHTLSDVVRLLHPFHLVGGFELFGNALFCSEVGVKSSESKHVCHTIVKDFILYKSEGRHALRRPELKKLVIKQ